MLNRKMTIWGIGEIYYQRAHKLRKVWQNPTETKNRKEKAYTLWVECVKKVMSCFLKAQELTVYKNHFPLGGTINTDTEKVIISEGEPIISRQ